MVSFSNFRFGFYRHRDMLLHVDSIALFQIPILVDCSGRRLSGSELPPWSISYPANMNHDHVIVDLDLSGKFKYFLSLD